MKKCPKCGQTYDDSWKVCLHCSVNLLDDLSIKESNPELRNNGKKEIPKGINIIANLGIICGIFFILLGFGGSFQVTGILRSLLYLVGFILFGIILIMSGIFIMELRQWARKLFIFQMCLIIGYGIGEVIMVFVRGAGYSNFSWVDFVGSSAMFLPVPIYCIYYVTRPKVKKQFR